MKTCTQVKQIVVQVLISIHYLKTVIQYRNWALVDDTELSVIKTWSDIVLVCKPT